MDAPHAEEEARYWLAQIARGDRSAFEKLFRAYEVRLYRYLLSMVREKQQAEELVNDVMVEVWRGAPRFRNEAKPSTWLFGIAYHKAIDALREAKASLRRAARGRVRRGPALESRRSRDGRDLAAQS